MENIEKVVIIGSGPAGYTAAIYCARAGLTPLLLKGAQPGGQLITTTDVENYPGFPNGIGGVELMDKFEKQALNFGTRVLSKSAVSINCSPDNIFCIDTSNKQRISSQSIIIATGSTAKYLGIESEQRFLNKGVSACAICDGFFYKNKDVCVVGGGDSAAEESLYLSKICKSVKLLVRKDKMRASKIMQSRLEAKKNIEIIFMHEILEILGNDSVEGAILLNNTTEEKVKISASAIFIAIGHTPNTSFLKGLIDIDQNGYIKTLPGTSKTTIQGLFAAGDVQDPIYRQAITSAGSGCIAALDAERFLNFTNE